MALSPDGRQIAFIANQNGQPMLWVRPLDAVESRALAGTQGASLPFWAPDGHNIAFFAEGKLKRTDIAEERRWWSRTCRTAAAARGTPTA